MELSRTANVVLWIALVLGVLCSLALGFAALLAMTVVVELQVGGGSGGGFAFLFVVSWLAILGLLATIFGVIGLYWSKWSSRRGWFATIVGIASLVVGFSFGVPLLF